MAHEPQAIASLKFFCDPYTEQTLGNMRKNNKLASYRLTVGGFEPV